MAIENAVHPAKNQLIAFGQGMLPADESLQVESHLEVCPACCETLLDLKDDTFVGLVRIAQSADIGIPVADRAEVRPDANVDPSSSAAPTDGNFDAPSEHAATLLVQSGDAIGVDELPAELAEHPRYRIVELIGRGGMGNVYRAEHRLMNRAVAIKLINAELMQHPHAVERFRREVQAAAKLSHPNIVAAYDAEQAGNAHFLVMEFVDGTDLATVVKQRGPMSVADACDCIRQAAAGLQHAHEKGMVHRDIKPHNLMQAAGGQVRILDFGLAGFASESVGQAFQPDSMGQLTSQEDIVGQQSGQARKPDLHLTTIGSVMGTPDYMAPEQAADAHSADIRADIYSLGCTLYFLLTGKPPFEADNVLMKLKAHAEQSPAELTSLRKDVPAELSKVAVRMMAKNPAERFQTPAAVADMLAPFAKPAAILPKRRARTFVVALLFALLAGVIVVQTDKGRVEIRSEVNDVKVSIKQAGKEVDEIRVTDAQTGSQVKWLSSGEYEVELKDGRNDVEIINGGFKLTRWGKEVVILKLKPDANGVAAKDSPQTTASGKSPLAAFRDYVQVTAYLNHPNNNRGGSVPVALLGQNGLVAFRFGNWLVVFEGIACDPKATILGFSNFNIPQPGSSGEGTIDFGAGDKLPGVLIKYKFANEQNEISINNNRFKLKGKATRLEFDDKAYDATNSVQTILVARDGSTRLAESAAAQNKSPATNLPVRAMSETVQLGFNGSFEITKSGLPVTWFFYTPRTVPNADFDIVMDTTDFKEGEQSLKFVVRKCESTGGNRSPGFFNEFHVENHNPPGPFETKPGETYKISFWAKNAGSEFVFKARGVSAFGGDKKGAIIRSKETFNEWRRFECSYTIPPKMWLRLELNVVQPGTFWIDDLQIAKVNEKAAAPEKSDDITEVGRFTGHEGSASHAIFSPSGRYGISCGSDKTIRVWDIATQEEKRVLKGHEGRVWGLAISTDGKLLASGDDAKSIRLWNLETGEQVGELTGHTDGVSDLAFMPDRTHLLSAGFDKTLRLWHVADRKLVKTIDIGTRVEKMLTLTDDRRVMLSGAHTRGWGPITYDLEKGEKIAEVPGLHSCMAVSADGRLSLIGSITGVLVVTDTVNGKELVRMTDPRVNVARDRGAFDAAITPDGRFAITTTREHFMYLWDLHGGKLLSTVEGDTIGTITLSPDGRFALTIGFGGEISVWRLPETVLEPIGAAGPRDDPKTAAVTSEAREWLKLVDTGKFAECWEACAKFVKAAVTKEQVAEAYGVIRKPLGVAQTRVTQSVNSFPQLPGTPPGESVVVQFETTFSIGGKQLEQITLYWDQDNHWRVAGYHVTPAPSEPKKDQGDPATEQKKQAALTAAQQWLKLIDAGKYGEAWDTSAKANKDGIKQDAMDLAYQGLFRPLGAIKSRGLKSNDYKTQLPGAPVGEYAVIQFSTQFTNGRVTETVVLTREADGQWRVSGYFHAEDKSAPTPSAGTNDEPRLQGSWIAVSGLARKQPIPAEQLAKFSITFDGAQVTIAPPGNPPQVQHGTFKINATSIPKRIDFIASDKNETMPGIYEFDGEQLKLAVVDGDYARPTTFDPEDRADHMTLVFKRVCLAETLGDEETQVLKAAEAFLAVMDEGRFGELFNIGSMLAKRQSTRDQISQTYQRLRDTAGKNEKRTLQRVRLFDEFLGLPPGRYAAVQYASDFEKHKGLWETVLLNVDDDGVWRANTYAALVQPLPLPEPKKKSASDASEKSPRPASSPPTGVLTGANLLTDPSFENTAVTLLPRGWSAWLDDGPDFRCEVVEGGPKGKHCLMIAGKGTRGVVFANVIPVDRTKRYALKGWANFEGDKDARAIIKFNYFKDSTFLGVHDLVGVTADNVGWQFIEKTDALDRYPEANKLYAMCHVEGNGSGWFDDLEVIAYDRDKLPIDFDSRHGRNNRLSGLQSLGRWVGAWETKYVFRDTDTSPEQMKTMATTTERTLGDYFLLSHEKPTAGDEETIQFLTFDQNIGAFRQWLFSSNGKAFEWRGQWDDSAKSLELRMLPDSSRMTLLQHFVDADHIEATMRQQFVMGVKDAGRWMSARKAPTANVDVLPAKGFAAEPAELAMLNKFAGEWIIREIAKPSVWIANGHEKFLIEEVEWVLGGRFLMARAYDRVFDNKNRLATIWLATWEPLEKAYRFWFFSAEGWSGQWRVTWDASSRGFHWRSIDMPTGWIGTGFNRWINDDTFDNQALIKDETGRVLLDSTQDKRRKK